MKKLIAILMSLSLIFATAMTALAEEPQTWNFHNGIEFNMDMEQVMETTKFPNPEIENFTMRGPIEFSELEYEKITDDLGMTADIKYFFVGNSLVAFKMDCADGTSYDAVKEQLVSVYGEAVPFNASKIGNGKFVIDDDGELQKCSEMIEANGLTIVLEKDRDGDVDVTFLDMTAAYINH